MDDFGFGKRVKERREKLALTQKILAKMTGVSDTTIQGYEYGKMPNGRHLIKLSKALKCTSDWLLTGVEKRVVDVSGHEFEGNEPPVSEDFIYVRTAIMKNGLFVPQNDAAFIAFRKKWLFDVSADPEKTVILTMQGKWHGGYDYRRRCRYDRSCPNSDKKRVHLCDSKWRCDNAQTAGIVGRWVNTYYKR